MTHSDETGKKTGRFLLMRFREGESVGGEAGRRIEELERKSAQGLSEEEFRELRLLYEKHTESRFLEAPPFTAVGVTDPERFIANFVNIGEDAEYAYQSGFPLEALTLRVALLDLLLRAYVVSSTSASIEPHSKQDKQTFGGLINDAGKHGLAQEIVQRLTELKDHRNSGLHNYLLGRTSLQEIADAYRDSDGLDDEILGSMTLPYAEND